MLNKCHLEKQFQQMVTMQANFRKVIFHHIPPYLPKKVIKICLKPRINIKYQPTIVFRHKKLEIKKIIGGSIFHRGGPFSASGKWTPGPFSAIENGPGGHFPPGPFSASHMHFRPVYVISVCC